VIVIIKELMMKLYIVTVPGRTYKEVLDVAKQADTYAIITVVEKDKSYEFQSKLAADNVAKTFEGSTEVIEYDIKNIMK
jgi:hypothetical protein